MHVGAALCPMIEAVQREEGHCCGCHEVPIVQAKRPSMKVKEGVELGAVTVATFTMRGNDLYDARSNTKIGTVSGNAIYNAMQSRVARIRGQTIYDAMDFTLATVKGNEIYDRRNLRIGSVATIMNTIDGSVGRMAAVALWLVFIRGAAQG